MLAFKHANRVGCVKRIPRGRTRRGQETDEPKGSSI